MSALRAIFCGLLLGLLSACGAAELEGPCGLTFATELPVSMAGRIPTVEVAIAGKPVTMILDTGAQTLLLTQSAVTRLGLRTDARSPVTVRGTGGETRNWPAVVSGLTLGRVRMPDQHAAVLPFDLPEIGGAKVDGLLGMDVLGRFEMDLNLPQKRVALHMGHACPDAALPIPGPLVAMDVPSKRRNRLSVHVILDGQPMNALIDTGTERSIVMTEAAFLAGTTPEMMANDPVTTLRGAGPGMTQARLHRFRTLQIAGESFRNPMLQVMGRQADEDDMIIGSDYLANRRLWLAYRRQVVLVQRPPAPAVPVAALAVAEPRS